MRNKLHSGLEKMQKLYFLNITNPPPSRGGIPAGKKEGEKMNVIQINRLENGKFSAWTPYNRQVHFLSRKLDFIRRKSLVFAQVNGLRFIDVQ